MQRTIVSITALFTLASIAGACSSAGEPGPVAVEKGEENGSKESNPADSEWVENGVAESESALVADPRKCERMQLTHTAEFVDPDVMAVPGPYAARIISHGNQISCNGPSGDLETPFTWSETFKTRRTSVGFSSENLSRGSIAFVPALEPQDTGIAVYFNPIPIVNCKVPTITLKTPGFPDRSMAVTAWMSPPVFGREGGFTTITLTCHARVKGPVTSIRARPANLVRASGDTFTYACDLNATDRRNACSSLCSSQCTANVGFPPDTAGINACINTCTNRCANVSCPPVLCSGSNCPQPGQCAPQNQCGTNSQCGIGRECLSGCCLTIIR